MQRIGPFTMALRGIGGETLQLDNTLILKRFFFFFSSRGFFSPRGPRVSAPGRRRCWWWWGEGRRSEPEVKPIFLICRPETMGSPRPLTFDLPRATPLPLAQFPGSLTDAAVRSGEPRGALAAEPVDAVHAQAAVVAAETETRRAFNRVFNSVQQC